MQQFRQTEIQTAPLPASTLVLFTNSPATTPVGTDTVNGEPAIRYDMNTARDTAAAASLIKSVLGPGGFIKGSVWVTGAGVTRTPLNVRAGLWQIECTMNYTGLPPQMQAMLDLR